MDTIGKAQFRIALAEMLEGLLDDAADHFSIDFTTDPTNGNLIIAVDGATIDDDGNIAAARHNYDWSATVTLTLSGTVPATSATTGEEAVEDWLRDNLNIIVTAGHGSEVEFDDWNIDDTTVDSVY